MHSRWLCGTAGFLAAHHAFTVNAPLMQPRTLTLALTRTFALSQVGCGLAGHRHVNQAGEFDTQKTPDEVQIGIRVLKSPECGPNAKAERH